MMTMGQAVALQVGWKQRACHTRCEHIVLELRGNEQDYLAGHCVCNLCEVSVAHCDLAV